MRPRQRAANKRRGRMCEMYYKQVELKEGEPVLFVGCHVLKWPYDVQLPDVGFVEANDVVEDLLEALKALQHADGCYCDAAFAMPDTIVSHSDECDAALAAIAKAEGREP